MNIKLEEKFADKNLDIYIDAICKNLRDKPSDDFVFDLTEVEYIGNQELLVLSALFKSFVESKIKFRVILFEPSSPPNDRTKRQIIEIWDVWKIWKTVPDHESRDYFGIDRRTVDKFKKELNYHPKSLEIYSRYGVTPFISLDYINNYNEREIQEIINPIYRLNFVIEDLLEENKCRHPFTSHSLSTIITEELYLNFLDHSLKSLIPNCPQMAFMSISFHRKLDEVNKTHGQIQYEKKLNFETESLKEALNFFYDSKTKTYKNQSYIEFSFLDFGEGIVNTLERQFLSENESSSDKEKKLHSDILRYAFKHTSSRHPIYHEKNKVEQFIPRGLFDVLTIVRRYKGLLVVRSNFGKVLFDFSLDSDIDKAFSYFGNDKLFFPGTLISFYIPAIEDASKLDVSSIKPAVDFAKVKPENKKYINVNTIVEKLNVPKEDLYSRLLRELKNEIIDPQKHSLVFISFKGCTIEKRVIKKTLYFLLTDYEVNHRNNVVILNSPSENVIEDIASEILNLNTALRNYKLHPLPIIDFSENDENLIIRWLGIYDDSDKETLNNLIYKDYTIARSDLLDPTNATGHLNAFDSLGNLISNFPTKSNIIEFFRLENEAIISKQVKELLEKHDCIKDDQNNTSVYLCSGNYYQKAYVELNNLVNDKSDCDIISNLLFSKLKSEVKNLSDFKFIGITATSDKLLKSLESQSLISSDYISIDNYRDFENELDEKKIDPSKEYILICHVISSGFMTDRLNARLAKLRTKIKHIAVIVSILDPNFELTKSFLEDYKDRITFLYEYPITKLARIQLADELFSKEIIRINPYTNIPIQLSIDETNFNESVIFHTQVEYLKQQNEIIVQNKFLDRVNEDVIHVGFYKFNNVIHPYFFKTEEILQNLPDELLQDVFKAINRTEFSTQKVQVFYPRKSGIEHFSFSQLKAILKNQRIEEIEIERFGTPEGWRFPHNTDYLSAKIENSFCLILDDGSCSGDSLIQMIDEISFYDAREIVLLCIIGRVNDHKREFFSRLSQIRVKNGKAIPVSIYFVCHWHIPTYYIDENPNIQETAWLNQIINLQNTPQTIKKIASSVAREIKPKDDLLVDYKYLPKTKDTGKIPKKELLIVREELGKVIGYRLYKESFKFFDSFIKKYEKKKDAEDRYKEIELLCATFVYEPYLFARIVGVLPDVVEKIEEFVRILIFSDQRIYEKLTYKWKPKDIIHLFFIVFKNEKLIKELTIERFKQLIEFTQRVESTTNYILYKLLKYFPLTPDEFTEKKFDGQIKNLINRLKDDESISNKEIIKYYRFIISLPSREDFDSQLGLLASTYYKQETPEFHLENKSFDNNISGILSAVRACADRAGKSKPLLIEHIYAVREKWFATSEFVIPILTFSSSFPDYLIPYSYFDLIKSIENGENSVREMVGFNERIIFSLEENYTDTEKLVQLEKNILKMQSVLRIDSTFHQLIKSKESNLYDLISGICEKLIKLNLEVILSGEENLRQDQNIMIPRLYSENLLKNELVTNIKNHSSQESSSKVTIEISLDEKSNTAVKITNKRAKEEYNKSNLEGVKCLNLMAESELFYFDYEIVKSEDTFIQILTFENTR